MGAQTASIPTPPPRPAASRPSAARAVPCPTSDEGPEAQRRPGEAEGKELSEAVVLSRGLGHQICACVASTGPHGQAPQDSRRGEGRAIWAGHKARG